MKMVQRVTFLLSILLTATTIFLWLARQSTHSDVLLLHDYHTQEILALDSNNGDSIRIDIIPVALSHVFRISPNGEWLYYVQGWEMMAYNMSSGVTKKFISFSGLSEAMGSLFNQARGETMLYYKDGQARRVNFNEASDTVIEIDIPLKEPDQYFGDPIPLPSSSHVQWIEYDQYYYRLDADDKVIQRVHYRPETISPNEKWRWGRLGDFDYFVTSLVDNSTYVIPEFEGRYMYLSWTPDSALVARYTFRDELDRRKTTILRFKDGIWTTLLEDVYSLEGTLDYSPLSPDSGHYLFFQGAGNLQIINLDTDIVLFVDNNVDTHQWNRSVVQFFLYAM